jgi:hypothetical protein
MRSTTSLIEPFRVKKFSSEADGYNGLFVVPDCSDDGAPLRVIASTGFGWDHVSVLHPFREPSNREMSRVKDLFFWWDENVIEFHDYPPVEWDIHENVTGKARHMWSPQGVGLPRPPDAIMSPFLIDRKGNMEGYEEIEGSSNIVGVKYDGEKKSLMVVFTSGGHYMYSEVPEEVYEGFMQAESRGKYFHKNIRNIYPALKVEEKEIG